MSIDSLSHEPTEKSQELFNSFKERMDEIFEDKSSQTALKVATLGVGGYFTFGLGSLALPLSMAIGAISWGLQQVIPSLYRRAVTYNTRHLQYQVYLNTQNLNHSATHLSDLEKRVEALEGKVYP
jgi:hypothetical protein